MGATLVRYARSRAGLEGRMPRLVASGGRERAFDDFRTALKTAGTESFTVLLVDSEAAVAAGNDPWAHLKSHDDWDKPAMAADDGAHLMVQCMESWFLADKDTLAAFFGSGFNPGALPASEEVEDIPKQDVLSGLKAATRHCGQQGRVQQGQAFFRDTRPDRSRQSDERFAPCQAPGRHPS